MRRVGLRKSTLSKIGASLHQAAAQPPPPPSPQPPVDEEDGEQDSAKRHKLDSNTVDDQQPAQEPVATEPQAQPEEQEPEPQPDRAQLLHEAATAFEAQATLHAPWQRLPTLSLAWTALLA